MEVRWTADVGLQGRMRKRAEVVHRPRDQAMSWPAISWCTAYRQVIRDRGPMGGRKEGRGRVGQGLKLCTGPGTRK